jgi:2-dehydro-3-deoxyphosphogluconate aldolase/(4S)-4-hydroxy-2-oxoglutarate aldolase
MMKTEFSAELFWRLPLVGILRGFRLDQIGPIVEACLEGGLTNLEITMNTDGADEQIRVAVEAARGRMNIGAGTVTSLERLGLAVDAGASYIVTPAVIGSVMDRCRGLNLPFLPGAFTPTEVWQAWDAGATMVKLFPADFGGPAYVKSLKGPYPEIPVMATGGVSLESIGEYLAAGAQGFGLGGPLFKRDKVDAGEWGWIAEQVRAHREIYDAFQAGVGR